MFSGNIHQLGIKSDQTWLWESGKHAPPFSDFSINPLDKPRQSLTLTLTPSEREGEGEAEESLYVHLGAKNPCISR